MDDFKPQTAHVTEDGVEWKPDLMSKLGHRLIREVCGDAFDPFFVIGHPFKPQTEKQLVRACFYYALIIGPKVTVLFSNFDRGGMCDLVPEEIVGIWRTTDISAAYGVSFDDLRLERGELRDAPMPENLWKLDDEKVLDPAEQSQAA